MNTLAPSTRRDAVGDFAGRWRRGERTPAQAFLSERPELGRPKSLVLDLVLEEISLRRESGETILPSTFCDQFPAYRRSLQRMLLVRSYVDSKAPAWDESSCHWPVPGETFLQFEILDELGRGSFASVYLARQEELGGRLVALKVARQGSGEAKTLGRLRHENIVPAHSISTDSVTGLTAVCMPYLGKATLCDLLDKAFCERVPPASGEIFARVASEFDQPASSPDIAPPALPPESYVDGVARVVRQLALALAYTHSRGILHRDLKPSNVLLAPGGVPMLLDFNLAVDLDRADAGVGGTLPYTPPELLRWMLDDNRQSGSLNDPRSDIFSLGVIFHELLTGSLPFGEPEYNPSMTKGANEMLALQARVRPPLSVRNPQVDPALERIVTRCLSLDLADRYATADELALDLERYLCPDRRREAASRQRRRALFGVGIAALTLALAGSGWLALNASTRLTDYEQGIYDYERGQAAWAVASFDRHLARHPGDAAGLFARGQAHRSTGDLTAAEADFLQAAKSSEAGLLQACLGYCLIKRGASSQAMVFLEKALQAGYDTAEVRGNLAFAQFQQGMLKEARGNLDRSIAMDPNGYAAHHLRALVAIQSSLVGNVDPTPSDLADMDLALQLGPPTTQLLADAALLHAVAIPTDPAELEPAGNLLVRALAAGLAKDRVVHNPFFAKVRELAQVRERLDGPDSSAKATTADLLTPPSTGARLEDF